MSEIEVEGVTKTYGPVTALEDVSLRIPEGCIFGLLGTNGAGKTTLFKLIIGHERPDRGRLDVCGQSPRAGKAVRRRVGYVPEDAGFPGSFTGREILSFHADMRDVPRSRRTGRVTQALDRVGLGEAANRRVDGYSKGMNRRLALATVLVAEPSVLILDEPTAGLDPRGIDAFHDVIHRLAEERPVTVVFSSHTLAEVEELCERIAVLDGGQLRTSGSVNELRRSIRGPVQLELWFPDGQPSSQVLERIREHTAVKSVDPAGSGRLTLQCGRTDVFEVLYDLREDVGFEDFEVRQPGLEDVFRQALHSSNGTELETSST